MRSEKREKHVAVLEQLGGDLPRFALLLKILKPFIGIPLDSLILGIIQELVMTHAVHPIR